MTGVLAHAGQLHAMDLVGLTASVVAAAIPGLWMVRNALRRRREARSERPVVARAVGPTVSGPDA